MLPFLFFNRKFDSLELASFNLSIIIIVWEFILPYYRDCSTNQFETGFDLFLSAIDISALFMVLKLDPYILYYLIKGSILVGLHFVVVPLAFYMYLPSTKSSFQSPA